MATLLYHWNFTGANDLAVDDEINDSESNLKAVFKSRGSITSSSFSRGDDGITLNNTDEKSDDSGYYDGGYYIELEGLNSTQLSGNISVEMVLQNHKRNIKGLYFSRTNSATELTKYGPTLVARYSTKIDGIKFSARTRSTEELNYTNRTVDEDSPSIIDDDDEHHYIFSVHYDSSGSSVKIYIDGSDRGENTNPLEEALISPTSSSNIIGTNKSDVNTTYLKGVVKYLKIYQNSMSDSQAESIYNSYNTSPYLSNVGNGTNGEKFTRRHDDVESYFTNNSSATSFSITGNQLGLSNGSENYKVLKFTHGDTFTISDNYNYIPIKGLNKFAILNYGTKYFRITQTSEVSDENAKYKCELSEGNTDNFTEVCSEQGFGNSYTNGNITIIFGGAEFNISNEICFHEDTIIDTDQGKIKIKDLKSYNTIGNTSILYLIKSEKKHKELVLVKKDAFGKNKPNCDVKLTKNHLILLKNGVFTISKLVNNSSIVTIDNNSEVYNIILLNNNYIKVSNIFLNVFGIDDNYMKKLEKKKADGFKDYEINFLEESKVKLDLSKLRNF